MATPTPFLIGALRTAARNLSASDNYQWGHMGHCNCGHLAQVIVSLKASEIHKYAMQKHGDWSEQLNDYCPSSGLPMDALITEMLDAGFDSEDLRLLEKLSDPRILRLVPEHRKPLVFNKKDDVIVYLQTWARLLEDIWLAKQEAHPHVTTPQTYA